MSTEIVGLDELLSIDVDAQLSKLATCQLEDDLALVIELLRAAVLAGADDLKVTQRRGCVRISATGPLLSADTARALKVAAEPRADRHERQGGIELVERNAGTGWLALLGRKDLVTYARCTPGDAAGDLSLNSSPEARASDSRFESSLAEGGSALVVRGLKIKKRLLQRKIAARLSPFGPALTVFGVDPRSLQTSRERSLVRARVLLCGLEPTLEGSFVLSEASTGEPACVILSHGGFVHGRITLENLQGFELMLNLDPLGTSLPNHETLRRAIQNSTFEIEERLAHTVAEWAESARGERLSLLRGLVSAALTYRRESPLRFAKVFEYLDSAGCHRASWDELVSSTGGAPFTYVDSEASARLRSDGGALLIERVWIADPGIVALLRDEYAVQVRAFQGARRSGIRSVVHELFDALSRVASIARGRPLPRTALETNEVSVLQHLNISLDARRSKGRTIELSEHRGRTRCTKEHWLLPRAAPLTRELLTAVHVNLDAAYLAILALGHRDAVPTTQATTRFQRLIERLEHHDHHGENVGSPGRPT